MLLFWRAIWCSKSLWLVEWPSNLTLECEFPKKASVGNIFPVRMDTFVLARLIVCWERQERIWVWHFLSHGILARKNNSAIIIIMIVLMGGMCSGAHRGRPQHNIKWVFPPNRIEQHTARQREREREEERSGIGKTDELRNLCITKNGSCSWKSKYSIRSRSDSDYSEEWHCSSKVRANFRTWWESTRPRRVAACLKWRGSLSFSFSVVRNLSLWANIGLYECVWLKELKFTCVLGWARPGLVRCNGSGW